MTTFRLLWALFLAGLVAFAFHRSWCWEHGTAMPAPLIGDKNRRRSKDTAVWVTPLVFPLFLALVLGLYALLGQEVRSFVLDMTLTINVYFFFLLLLLPLLRRSFSARACATLWLLPVFLFYQPHILLQTSIPPFLVIYIPKTALWVCGILWAVGFVSVLAGKFLSHVLFRREMLKNASPVTEPEVIEQWQEAQKWAEYYRPIRLLRSPATKAPFSMGRTARGRVTVLPEREYTAEELRFLFRHELCHIQRSDVDTKIFLAFCGALCWFNPLVWAAIRRASADLELSCDEQVLRDCGEEERQAYAALLLRSAGHARGFTTCLSAAARSMRYRLRNVVRVRPRRRGALLLAVFMFVFTMAFGVLAVSTDRCPAIELFQAPDVDSRLPLEIRSVSYRGEGAASSSSVWAWDEEALLTALSQVEVEELNGISHWADADADQRNQSPRLFLELRRGSQTWWLYCGNRYLTVTPLFQYQISYYCLTHEPDWARISAALDFDAEEPRTPDLLAPNLLLYFQQDESTPYEGPLYPVCRSLWIQDAETGGVLRVRGWDESPGGIYGEPLPTQVRMVFELPVAQITASAREPDGAVTQLGLSREADGYTLDLLPRAAIYTVSVLSEARESLIYTGTYVFEVAPA